MRNNPVVRCRAARAIALLGAIVLPVALQHAPRALAAVETTADPARIELPAPASAFAGASNTVFLWLRRAPATGSRVILDIPGALNILTNAEGDVAATASAPDHVFNLMLPAALPENEWALLTLTVSHPNGDVTLAVETASGGFRSHGASRAAPFALGPVTGPLTLGATGGRPAMQGVYGILVVRNHAVSLADARDIFAARRHFGPFEYRSVDTGGTMTGVGGARWMINHSLFSQPYNASGQNYSSLQVASRPDADARVSDFAVFDRSAGLHPDKLRVIRPVNAVDGFVYRSPFDVDPGFFLRDSPEPETPLPPNPVAAVSPRARALAESAPASGTPMRVIASANSRGVNVQDALGAPGNFAHGFTLALRDDVAGIILRPAGTSDVGPYFGLYSTTGASHRIRRTPDCLPVEPTNFARFWTGSLNPDAGPGLGTRLTGANSSYALRCRPEQGSRLVAERPLTVRAYLLAYPGAPTVEALADVGQAQSDAGSQSPVAAVDLNTTLDTLTTTVAAAPDLSTIDVAGDRAAIPPGTAIALGHTAFLDISVVTSATYQPGADTTRLTLEHALRQAPAPGVTARFGPHRIEVIEYTHPPAIAPNLWRGLMIRRNGAPALDAVLYAFDAFNPEDGGFAIGPAGWSGRGYSRQITSAFSDGVRNWIAAADADLWLQFIAHQNSNPSAMSDFADRISAASPDTEIVWAGCVEYENTLHEPWHRYILDNARSEGVVGLSVLQHPAVGGFAALGADGGRADGAHLTGRGNQRIAEAALDLLRDAARWPGDANNDGTVSFADLNIVLANLGATGPADGSLPGDVTLDGAVDFADLNAALSAFGTSVFD